MQAKAPVRLRNAVLDHISDKDFAQLEPLLQPVELGFRKHLQSTNRKIDAVYFPESGLASVVAIGGGERKQAEVAIIGREGFVGLPYVYGLDRSPYEIFMQVEGVGHSVSADAFLRTLRSVSHAPAGVPPLRVRLQHSGRLHGARQCPRLTRTAPPAGS